MFGRCCQRCSIDRVRTNTERAYWGSRREKRLHTQTDTWRERRYHGFQNTVRVECFVIACYIKRLVFYFVCSVLSYNQRVMFMLSVIYHHDYISNTPVSLKQYHSLVLLPKYKFSCKRLVEHFIYSPYKLLSCCPLYWIHW